MGNARSVTVILVAAAAYLATALAGCGRPAKTGTGGAAGPSAVGQAHVLTQAQIDAIIPPLPESERAGIEGSSPNYSLYVDKLRAIYASLPAEARQQMQTKGEYAFHVSDLPREQGAVIRDLITKDKDMTTNLGGGKPVDFAQVTFSFKHGDQDIEFRGRRVGMDIGWAPIGRWAGK